MILLDTCALLWMDADREAFTRRALDALYAHADALAVSPVSFHEVGTKSAKKRLRLPMSPAKWSQAVCDKYGLTVLPVTREIAVLAATLPPIHTDPFDRIIIATARINNLGIVTADTKFGEYPGLKVIWKDSGSLPKR